MQYNGEGQAPTTVFSSYRDLDVLLEETKSGSHFENTYLNNMLNTGFAKELLAGDNNLVESSYTSTLPLRRIRAGTMPSISAVPVDNTLSNIIDLSLKPRSSSRHRSESLTLPVPPSGYSWRKPDAEPTSPSTEQFLQQGDDIARTLRSIGLDNDRVVEDNNSGKSSLLSSNKLSTPLAGSPSLLLPISRRNRSQSMNNASAYQLHQQASPYYKSVNFPLHETSIADANVASIDNGATKRPNTINRARSVSMGRMDYIKKNRPSSSLWKNDLDTLMDDTLYEVEDSDDKVPSLSLDDSELLVNMIQSKNNNTMNLEIEGNDQGSPSNPENPIKTSPTNPISQQTSHMSRSLWIGNISSSLTADVLNTFFSTYGPIESVRLLTEKDCAFVNFYNIDDAVNAKKDILDNLEGKIDAQIVRIGYGRAENLATPVTTAIETPVVPHPTRSLWLGSMPTGTTQASLQYLFSIFGNIESIRVLSQKNCAFINFEDLNSAIFAREALVKNEPVVKELWGVRVGFAKDPSSNYKSSNYVAKKPYKARSIEEFSQINREIWAIMKDLGANDNDTELAYQLYSSSYFESIPPVPEYMYLQRQDPNRLKDTRKRIDLLIASNDTPEAFDLNALDFMNEIAELSSDHIGNIIVQRFFEKCSDDVKNSMLTIIAPHLAALGVHKNGTWAAQKIIDSTTSTNQIRIINENIQPFIPPLLLDQFGNYVVQCCLKLKGDTQYIVNAIVDKLPSIAQGRFGARAIRGVLESKLISAPQQMMIIAAIIRHSALLAVHNHGSILVTWIIESSTLNNRLSLLSDHLTSSIVQTTSHKLGSQILLKLVNQNAEPEAREKILTSLKDIDALSVILKDQTRGLPFVIKVMSSDFLSSDEKVTFGELTYPILRELQGVEFKKASVEFVSNIQL